MRNWIKGLGSSVWIGILGFLAAMAIIAAKRQKDSADKWKGVAVDIESGNVVKVVSTAAAANTMAALHDSKARQIEKKAKIRMDQMGGHNEEVSVLLDRWRSD